MITLRADFNHVDPQGRLRLGDLRMHQQTPFAEIAAKHEPIIFVDGEDVVRGELIHDPQAGGSRKWIGPRKTSGNHIRLSSPFADHERGEIPPRRAGFLEPAATARRARERAINL